RPTSGMGAAQSIDKYHLADLGRLIGTGEGRVDLVPHGVANLQIAGDLGDVEHGNRHGKEQRHPIAQINQRMERRQGVFFPKSPYYDSAAERYWVGLSPIL